MNQTLEFQGCRWVSALVATLLIGLSGCGASEGTYQETDDDQDVGPDTTVDVGDEPPPVTGPCLDTTLDDPDLPYRESRDDCLPLCEGDPLRSPSLKEDQILVQVWVQVQTFNSLARNPRAACDEFGGITEDDFPFAGDLSAAVELTCEGSSIATEFHELGEASSELSLYGMGAHHFVPEGAACEISWTITGSESGSREINFPLVVDKMEDSGFIFMASTALCHPAGGFGPISTWPLNNEVGPWKDWMTEISWGCIEDVVFGIRPSPSAEAPCPIRTRPICLPETRSRQGFFYDMNERYPDCRLVFRQTCDY